jgi:glucokinase
MNMEPCVIGIDFGKTNVRFAIAGEQPELKYFTKRPYLRRAPEDIHRQIFEGIDAALQEAGYEHSAVRGIGIDVPAVVNRETGVILWGPDWDFMAGASLTKPIAARYGVPVVADVDPVMATWGEQWAGVGKTCKRFAVLTWGTGLGAGLVIDGEVQEYPDNLFPEFGHSRVSDDDWPCKCGATGCIDTLVCGGGIARHGRLAVEAGRHSLLRDLCDNAAEKVTSPMVFEAAQRGDAVAIAILERVAVLLGRLCGNLVLTMQPEKIVIVGGLTDRCGWVLDTINRTMHDNCWLLFKGLTKCEVVASELGDQAGVLGAIRKVQLKTGASIK